MDGSFGVAEAERKLFCVLRQKARSRLHKLCLAQLACFQRNGRADCIAVAFCSTQAKDDCVAELFHCVAQNAELRRIAVLEDDFDAPVVV